MNSSRIFPMAVVSAAIVVLVGCQTPPGTPGGAAAPVKSELSVKAPVKSDAPVKAVGGGAKKVSFLREIKPILEDRCVMCHNRKILPRRTSFENRELALKGDASGAIIVPGNAEGSRLVVAISSPDFAERAMPPVSHRVTEAEVAKIRAWIDEGVEWPAGAEGDLKSDKVPAE